MRDTWIYSFLISLLAYFTIGSVFAAEIPTGLSASGATATSISLQWDEVSDALGYYVYYGTSIPENGAYEQELEDLIESPEATIDELSPATDYYIAVTSIDINGVESEKSEPLVAATARTGQVTNGSSKVFRIADVEVIDATTLDMTFSQPLDSSNSSAQEFIIQDAKTLEEISVDLSQVDESNPTHLLVLLGTPLDTNTKYDVTVLDIRDASGATIEDGINAIINFTTPSTFDVAEENIELNSAPISDDTPSDSNNADDSENKGTTTTTTSDSSESTSVNKGNAGVNISTQTSKNTLKAAENTDKLPQTGPQEWLLVFIALISAGGLLYFQRYRAQR